MLVDTPEPAMDLDPYAHDSQVRQLLATHLPLHPEGQLALLGGWLVARQDQQRAALAQAAGSPDDSAFMLLRAITEHLVEQVIGYSAELADSASRTQALLDHHRALEEAAALGLRVTAAASDENDLGEDVMRWVVGCRARHAAELAETKAAAETDETATDSG
jgi:hypothetical protein